MNKKASAVFILFAAGFLFWSCDYGQLGGADRTDTYRPGDELFEERLEFLCGLWYSHHPYTNNPMDGYYISEWSGFSRDNYPTLNTSFKTCSTGDSPQNGDYVLLYGGAAISQEGGSGEASESRRVGYMGLVRAINIFNGNINRGAVIIEYFEGTDPLWLSEKQGLVRGEKPFFGVYYRVRNANTVQMANAVDLAAMYKGKPYYTEKATLNEAIDANTVENESEFISWGVVYPQIREK